MRHGILLIATLAACGGGKADPAVEPRPAREVRLLTPADPSLRPLSLAAAGFLKTMPGNNRIGFGGVTIEGKDVPDLTGEIVRTHGFTQPPSRQRLEMECQPVQSGRAVMPANCRFRDFDVLYEFQYFRIARDSGYVGATMLGIEAGRPAGHGICIALSIDSLGWKPVRSKNINRSRDCGS